MRSLVPNPRQRGLTLAEMAVVLGIIALVIGALWTFLPLVYNRARQEQAFEQILLTVNNVRGFYLGQAEIPTGTLTTNVALRRGLVPPEMIRDKSAATMVADHAWSSQGAGGSYVVADDSLGGTFPGQFFTVQLLDLPLRICMSLVPRLTGTEGPSGVAALTINGTPLTPPTPVTVAAATTACSASPPQAERANVTLTYRLRE